MKRILLKINTTQRSLCIPILGLLLMIMGLNPVAHAWGSDLPLHCQVMGMSMTIEKDDVDVSDEDYQFYLFGAAAQKPLQKNRLEYGIEGGLLFSMENDSRLVEVSSGPDGGTVKVQFKNEMLLIDYFGGGYIGYTLTKRLRLYAGAGPLLVYGRRSIDPEDSDDDTIESGVESKLSAGFYGRTGFEFKITNNFMLGAGIRALTSGLKFSDPAGKIQYEGIQYVFTISYEITSF